MNLFVTGTDTEVGKTWATLGLMARLQGQGLRVNGMKPVASGSAGPAGRLRNADATLIQAQSSRRIRYAWVNPYAFAEPIAPHIAAAKAGVSVDLQVLDQAFHAVAAGTDAVIVEGAGGWRSPLAADLQASDLARRWGLSVVLVVGLRLGCINHALLTAESIRAAGLPLAGWLGNRLRRNYQEASATLDCLRERIPAPFLGALPRLARLAPAALGDAIDSAPLWINANASGAIDNA